MYLGKPFFSPLFYSFYPLNLCTQRKISLQEIVCQSVKSTPPPLYSTNYSFIRSCTNFNPIFWVKNALQTTNVTDSRYGKRKKTIFKNDNNNIK